MRLDDEKFLKRFSSDFNKIFPDSTNFSEIISAITDDKLSIERDGPDVSIKIDNEFITEIENALPYLLKITEKPHSFIKTYEDKTPVTTAKRISSKAISHLSRDSNDWFARTFLTVIPKNVLSDISEETFDLYENRFIITLIDKIIDIVTLERIKHDNMLENFNNERIQKMLINREYIRIQNNSNELSKKLLKKKMSQANVNTSFDAVSDYLSQLRSMEKKFKYMKKSELYSALRRCHRVRNPIQKTNILIFDPRYNAAYKLWEYLNNILQNEIVEIDVTERNCLPVRYNLYTLVTISAALKDMGFEVIKDSKIKYQDDILSVDKASEWKNNNDLLQLFYSNNKIELKCCIDKPGNRWDKIIIEPDISIDFENKSLMEVREQSDSMVGELAKRSNGGKIKESYFYFISMDIHRCSDDNDWGETIYRRFFNIGDNFSNEEKYINKLSFYQSGILIISPDNFQVNFLRIQRLINSRILKNKIGETQDNICPICGDKNPKRLNGNEIICNTCRHYISKSFCSNCNTEFLWIKYRDDKFLEDPEITKIFETEKYYIRMMRCEMTMKEYAITSFSIEKDKSNRWKLKSLCPKCGRKLGD
jgi:hypothetical protein